MTGSIGIVGAGAVGKGLAHALFKTPGISVSLFARSGLYTAPFAVEENGSLFQHQGQATAPKRFDLLFFTMKSYDLESALATWLKVPAEKYILLGNGYLEPILQPFRSLFPEASFVKGVVTRGAKFEDEVLKLSDGGRFSWGKEGLESALEKSLMEAAPELQWDPESCSARKDKWYCNTVLNTLSGAFRLPNNGSALGLGEIDGLATEVYELGTELWPEWKKAGEKLRLRTLLENMIRATRDNENSMAVDVRLGRPTEVAVLSGAAKILADHEKRFPLLTRLQSRIEHQKI